LWSQQNQKLKLDYRNRDDKGNAIRVKQENYNAFKTKNGRQVFDGGGVFPDVIVGAKKISPITKAIVNNDLIFDFATQYYYKHNINDIDLLTKDIVKRYVYREGLYEYLEIHDANIKKATDILSNPTTYKGYLK